ENPSLLGSVSSKTAPAPSDSIQRKNSLLKAKMGFSSTSLKCCTSSSKISARIQDEVRSDPVQTAFFAIPDFNAINPYFNAFMPLTQAPEGELISRFPFSRKP